MTDGGSVAKSIVINKIEYLDQKQNLFRNGFVACPKRRQLKESNPLARVFVFGIERENSPAANALTE